MGIPAVVPRLRTIEHYFSSDMVTYFEPEDLESLIEGIERLLSDPQVARRQAERAAAFFLEHGWDRQGAALVDFYRQLVES